MEINVTLNTISESAERNAQVLRAIADALHPVSQDETPQIPLPLAVKPAAATPSPIVPEVEPVISVPPVPPVAPKPPVAAATPSPAGAERDINGMPWDERIHSGSRAKVADGSWRKLRGVDAELVAQIETELKTEAPTPIAPVPPTPPVPPTGGVTFKSVMARITVGLANKLLLPSDITPRLKELGVESLPALDARPDLWDAALATLGV